MASLSDFFALPTVQDRPITNDLSQTIKPRIAALEKQVAMIQGYLVEMDNLCVNEAYGQSREKCLRALTECSDELYALRLARDEGLVVEDKQAAPTGKGEKRAHLPIINEHPRPVDMSAKWGSHMWRD